MKIANFLCKFLVGPGLITRVFVIVLNINVLKDEIFGSKICMKFAERMIKCTDNEDNVFFGHA